MKTDYSYDVAFSCAEEDLPVAKKIAESFRKKGISYYLYTEHAAQHWGENIFKISLDKYGAQARYVLMVISEIYVKKHWSDMERQIAQTVSRIGEAYILPVHLSNNLPKVDGLSANVMYVKWENDPEHIANLVAKKLKLMQKEKKKKENGEKIVYNDVKGDMIKSKKIGTIKIKRS
jgi:hypothetical protein